MSKTCIWSKICLIIITGAPYPPQVKDCRTKGCSHGECIRQGTEYICKQGKSNNSI